MALPHSFKTNHDELLSRLNHAVILCDKTGRTARKVAQLLSLHPHFIKNEQYALAPLALLPALAEGNVLSDMTPVIGLADQLKRYLPEMLAENQIMEATLQELINNATEEDHPEVVSFACQLMQLAKMEDDILYPAAILIGEYLKLRLRDEQMVPAAACA
ncbi:hypothetical protein V9K67_04350 [Paraflavisolibacter sp. H34]|uniref:hypothetical protein n=1 Tax=Huijunlia imazamoxiresistens TaxID=3127457 RepID=UPI00301817BC